MSKHAWASLGLVVATGLAAALVSAPEALAAKCPSPPGFEARRVHVPLDRSGAVSGKVSLCVQRRPASGARTGAVLALAGGPGQSATLAITDRPPVRRALLRAFAGTAESHDFVVFDQRGTRRSGYLSCLAPGAASRRPDALPTAVASGTHDDTRKCARQLGARRAFYTTFDSVEDIEAVRRALGVERLTLFAVSYGTKVAVAYARRYPAQVERLVLDSVLDPDGPDFFNLDSIAALPRVLASTCRATCRDGARDPVGELRELTSRLARRRLRGRVGNALTGEATHLTVGRPELLEDLMFGDLDPVLRASFPMAVHAALGGDEGPLLRLHAGAVLPVVDPELDRGEYSDAVFKATLCEELTSPWGNSSSVAERRRAVRRLLAGIPESAFDPLDRRTAASGPYVQTCLGWPRSARPAYRETAPVPSVPVLMLAGEDDLRTPVEVARATAARFPQAQLVTVAATGHSVLARGRSSPQSTCALRAVQGFLRGRPAPARCPGPRSALPMPVPPRSLRGVPAPETLPGRSDRVLGATLLTLRDALRLAHSVNPRGPSGHGVVGVIGAGLRSGAFEAKVSGALARPVTIERLVVRRDVYIPGVIVSARLARRSRALAGTVTIRGMVAGRLRLDGHTATGRVGAVGVEVPARLAARRG